MILAFATSCKSQDEVQVNGESVVLNDGIYANVQTNKGDVLIELYYKATPITVGNFVSLAEGTNLKTETKKGEPYFDGIIFHRVIADFMVQCGDPQGTGMGGPGYSFPDEFVDTLRHTGPGILSMANSGPNTNGSQFFITDKATPHLDGRHTVFGKVVSGLNIVADIARVPKNSRDKPNEDVVITKMTILRVGKDAKNFDAYKAFEDGINALEAEREAKLAARSAEADFFLSRYSWVAQGGAVDTEVYTPLMDEWEANMEITPSGLGYIVLEEGTGDVPTEGQQIDIDYVGYTADGKIFDTSYGTIARVAGTYDARRPEQAFSIQAGPRSRVIKGWQEASVLFKKGSKVKLIIPPALAYGERGAGGVIPPNATLVFDIYIHE